MLGEMRHLTPRRNERYWWLIERFGWHQSWYKQLVRSWGVAGVLLEQLLDYVVGKTAIAVLIPEKDRHG